jgi:hypothetical protein
VHDGVVDCCDCSDEPDPWARCVRTCVADAWARVAALRAAADDEADGAAVRAAVLAPAGRALHAAVLRALPGLEAQVSSGTGAVSHTRVGWRSETQAFLCPCRLKTKKNTLEETRRRRALAPLAHVVCVICAMRARAFACVRVFVRVLRLGGGLGEAVR